MDLNIAKNTIQILTRQRNAFIVLAIFLLLSNTLLSFLLFYKDEKVIILPSANQRLEFSNSSVSKSYIEEISYFLSYYLFTLNEENTGEHYDVVKKYLDPRIVQFLYNYFQDQKKYHTQYHSNQYFKIEELYVNNYEVIIKGIEYRILGKRQKLEAAKGYKLKFAMIAKRLKLIKFEEIEYADN